MNRNYMLENYSINKKNKLPYIITTLAILMGVSYVYMVSLGFIDLGKRLEHENTIVNIDDESKEKITTSSELKIEEKVNMQTIFKFKEYYENDHNVIEEIKRPSSYDVNLTREELAAVYKDWTIETFNEKEVVFSKTLNLYAPNYYVIKEKDGYMAIFYDDPDKGLRLREITDKKIEVFTKEEQEKLKMGIRVYGQEELIRLLEAYSS